MIKPQKISFLDKVGWKREEGGERGKDGGRRVAAYQK